MNAVTTLKSKLTILGFLLAILLPPAPVSAENPKSPTEREKIEYLLGRIENSGIRFERNGTEYDGKKAREHLEFKLNWAGSRIKTAEQFIRRLATESSESGKPYHVILPDGRRIESAVWLRTQLANLR